MLQILQCVSWKAATLTTLLPKPHLQCGSYNARKSFWIFTWEGPDEKDGLRESIIEDQYDFLTLIPESVKLYLVSYLSSVITLVVDMICTAAVTILGHLLLGGESSPESPQC